MLFNWRLYRHLPLHFWIDHFRKPDPTSSILFLFCFVSVEAIGGAASYLPNLSKPTHLATAATNEGCDATRFCYSCWSRSTGLYAIWRGHSLGGAGHWSRVLCSAVLSYPPTIAAINAVQCQYRTSRARLALVNSNLTSSGMDVGNKWGEWMRDRPTAEPKKKKKNGSIQEKNACNGSDR